MTEKSKRDRPSDVFPERLRAARELRGLNQLQLATAADLPQSSIAHFESGARKPSFDSFRRLAIALDITTDYLLGRVDKPDIALPGDALYRDAAKLTARDRELANDIVKMLADRNEASRK